MIKNTPKPWPKVCFKIPKNRLKTDFFSWKATKKPSKLRQEQTKKSRLFPWQNRLNIPSLIITHIISQAPRLEIWNGGRNLLLHTLILYERPCLLCISLLLFAERVLCASQYKYMNSVWAPSTYDDYYWELSQQKRAARLHQDNETHPPPNVCAAETSKYSVWWWGGGAAGGESTTISLIATWLVVEALCVIFTREARGRKIRDVAAICLPFGNLEKWLRFAFRQILPFENIRVANSVRFFFTMFFEQIEVYHVDWLISF
jgi:hypothetical protein